MERHIYILRLGERKWYVGVTNDMEARAWEHATGNGAAWTTHYGIQGLESHHLKMHEMDETITTLAMMVRYGIENVRGGPWTRMSITPADIEDQSLIMRHVRTRACAVAQPVTMLTHVLRRDPGTSLTSKTNH